MRKVRVALCIPSKDDWKANTALCFASMMHGLAQLPIATAILNQKGSMIADQRNELVKKAMSLQVDYVMWIDSDMMFPVNTVPRLIERQKMIVGGTYNKRVPPYETLGHMKGPKQDVSGGGIIQADYIPGGMQLVHIDVYKTLPYPWYFETYQWAGENAFDRFTKMLTDVYGTKLPEKFLSELYSLKSLRPFLEDVEKSPYYDNRVVSEDINFCRKAERHGFEIWCDLDLTYELIHLGEHGVTCKPEVKPKEARPVPSPSEMRAALEHVNGQGV